MGRKEAETMFCPEVKRKIIRRKSRSESNDREQLLDVISEICGAKMKEKIIAACCSDGICRPGDIHEPSPTCK